jgi:transcriptional regulator
VNCVPAFEITDREVIARLVRDLAFAQVVTRFDDGFTATSLPLLLDAPVGGGPWRLRGHLARSNPQARIGEVDLPAIALFVGPHAYVSPTSYPTRLETGKGVPTWNYVEVHVHGTFRLTDHPATTLEAVTELTDVHETGRSRPWSIGDAPDGYVSGLARGIVSFEIDVERVEAKAKLSQNKPAIDQAGVIDDLDGRAGPSGAVADLMRSGEFAQPGVGDTGPTT